MAYTTINKSSDYFETTTYTGGTTDISSLSFEPALVWAKKRDGAEAHGLFDAVRGALKALKPSADNAEAIRSGSLTSFDNDGWSMGGSDGIISASGSTYVGWAWKANGVGSANTDGSINADVSASPASGFSIVAYTGTGANATVGHGLGVAPKMIIAKARGQTSTWSVYHASTGATKFFRLNETNAEATETGWWNNTEPTSSVFTIGVNHYASTQVAYCFSEIPGFSKFSEYTGNGSDNGPFIYTGFKPAFVIIKSYSTNPWILLDNKRGPTNVNQSKIFPNDSVVENNDSSNGIDFLSNGFKVRRNNSEINTSGTPYIYMAFAEAPLVGTNGVTAKAR